VIDAAQQMQALSRGHAEMAICCLFYLVWWCIFFWPHSDGSKFPAVLNLIGVCSIVAAVIVGLLAAVTLGGVVSSTKGHIQAVWIVFGAVCLYVALLLVTSGILKRPATTELLLFVAWLALELCVINVLTGDLIQETQAWLSTAMLIATVIGFVVCLVCYQLYYQLAGQASFIDGCIPLLAIGLIEAAFALMA